MEVGVVSVENCGDGNDVGVCRGNCGVAASGDHGLVVEGWGMVLMDVSASLSGRSSSSQGGWSRDWGCSDGPGSALRRSRAAARGSERGRAGGSVVDDRRVVGDVAGRVDA